MKILLIGCGNVGGILLQKWSTDDDINQIVVVQPSLSKKLLFHNISKVSFVKDYEEIRDVNFNPDVVVIAIKPQNINNVLSKYKIYSDTAIFISLCTGTSIETLRHHLSNETKIVRIMPNIAMSIGKSVNLAYMDVASFSKQIVNNLFVATGIMTWLQQERLFDLLSPITGSGPAYFYLLAEELIKNAVMSGLDNSTATEIVIQTLIGSARLVEENHNLEQLRTSVTSKGGITEAALKVMAPNIKKATEEGINAALIRIQELSDENCR